MWKKSTVIPLPKSKNPTELNDFRPIALTSLVIKSFERILKDEITYMVQGKLNPLQFAYQEGKGVDDDKLCILDRVYKHLEKPKSFQESYLLTSLQHSVRCSPTYWSAALPPILTI